MAISETEGSRDETFENDFGLADRYKVGELICIITCIRLGESVISYADF